PVDTRLEVACLEVIENILLSLCPQFRVGKQFAERVSANGQRLAQRSKQRKRCWLERKCSVFEDCSTIGRRLSEQFDAFASDGVEDHASPFATGDLLHPC